MDALDLLENDLGHGQIDDPDTAPPMSLLTVISQRSGIELDRLRGMSFAGWVPWLLDSIDDRVPAALETYVFQLSVLLPRRRRKARSIKSWRAWLPSEPIRRACPLCLNDPADQPLLLAWKLPLMLSCPLHDCWLEYFWGIPGKSLRWENTDGSPRAVTESIAVMDRRTWQALTTGHVELPRRRVHAGLWFRLLRTLLDELNAPLSHCGSHRRTIRHAWNQCGHPLRAGQRLWRPYEFLDTTVQLQTLEAAAAALNLIETGVIRPDGEQVELLLPEPKTELTNGFQAAPRKNEPVSQWHEAMKALKAAFIEARHNPETARALFQMASYGHRDAASLERLREEFAKDQIPREFLSHY